MSLPPLAPLNVPALLRQYGLRPDKSLGQNFLVDESALRKIMAVAGVAGDEDVLEIGPGLGSLTRHLALAVRSVTAVELDARLMPPLKAVLAGYTNVSLVQGDILSLDPAELVSRRDLRTHIQSTWSSPTSLTTSPLPCSATCWRRSASPAGWC